MGGSFITGPGSVPRIGFAGDYRVTGADLTYKWISSSRSHGPALNLTAEVLWPDPEGYSGAPMGWYVISQYRFNHNWWLGLTHGRVDTDETGVQTAFAGIGETWESKLNFTYAPSEFSAMRVEISKYDDRLGDADDLRFSVQWNFTIGSHPAHTY
ncbi:hypothetical protein H8E07_17980, partial [bacterium]|nr:hypothetical protein [bacterium]